MSFIPELSVVATSRNDNHGGNLLARMQLFIDGFAEQAGRYRLPVELIVVEWNPLPDRPPLSEALQWRPGEMFQAQVTTVPADVHQALPNSARLPMYQMIAKNAGIRRAGGPYVLATNIDILLSDELFDYLKAGLKPNTMYRVDRLDVVAPLEAPVLPSPASVRAIRPIREHGMPACAIRTTRRPRSPDAPGATSRGSPWPRSTASFFRGCTRADAATSHSRAARCGSRCVVTLSGRSSRGTSTAWSFTRHTRPAWRW